MFLFFKVAFISETKYIVHKIYFFNGIYFALHFCSRNCSIAEIKSCFKFYLKLLTDSGL